MKHYSNKCTPILSQRPKDLTHHYEMWTMSCSGRYRANQLLGSANQPAERSAECRVVAYPIIRQYQLDFKLQNYLLFPGSAPQKEEPTNKRKGWLDF